MYIPSGEVEPGAEFSGSRILRFLDPIAIGIRVGNSGNRFLESVPFEFKSCPNFRHCGFGHRLATH